MKNGHAHVFEIAKLILRAKLNWKNPLYLIHAITARCNARCGFCAWNPDFYEGSEELSTEEVKKLYWDARKAGFVLLSVWGGEPLVRKDIGELLEYAKGLGFVSNVVTNGALLDRKLDQVAPYVDRICISVDHPSDEHDKMRGIKGLYGKILSATVKAKARYPDKKIVFNYTIQKANVDPDTIEEMAKVMKTLGVVGVFNGMRIDAASDDESINLSEYNPTDAELAEAFRKIKDLKKRGYPVVNSYTHIDKMMNLPMEYRCHWPKIMLPIEANGDVVDCQRWGQQPVGNIREKPFTELLKSPRLAALAGAEGEACHQCVSVHRIDISESWEGRVEPLVAWGKSLV